MWPFRRGQRAPEVKEAVASPVNAGVINPAFGLFLQPGEVMPWHAWLLYNNVATFAKVVDAIADNVAGLKPLIEINGQTMDDADALPKFLARPGFNRTRRRLIKELAVQQLVTGTGYLGLLGNVQYDPIALDVYKTWHVSPVQTAGLWPERYTYSEGARTVAFDLVTDGPNMRWLSPPVNEIVPIYEADGNRRGIGLSRLSAIKMDVELRLRGTEHNMSVMDKGARPSGIVSFKNSLSVDQYENVKAQLNSNMSGVQNAGSIAVTSGGEMDFKPLSMTAKDMDWVNLVQLVEDAIASRYGVPSTIYSTDAQTDNNYETAWNMFYDNAVLPTFNVIWDEIARVLSVRLQADIQIRHDALTNNILARQASARAIELKTANLVSTNEARTLVGYEAVIGGDIMYGSAGQVPVGEDFFTDHMDDHAQLPAGEQPLMLPGAPSVQQPQPEPNDTRRDSNRGGKRLRLIA